MLDFLLWTFPNIAKSCRVALVLRMKAFLVSFFKMKRVKVPKRKLAQWGQSLKWLMSVLFEFSKTTLTKPSFCEHVSVCQTQQGRSCCPFFCTGHSRTWYLLNDSRWRRSTADSCQWMSSMIASLSRERSCFVPHLHWQDELSFC